jgi:thiamine biosynthesis lipoprotein
MTATATDTFGVFGTTAVIVVTEPTALGPARAIADAELAAVDLACSRFRPDSELSRLNQARGEPTQISELFAALIAEALRAAELTGGDVDPTCAHALVSAGYDRDFAELRDGAAAPVAASPVPPGRCLAGALSGSTVAGRSCSSSAGPSSI